MTLRMIAPLVAKMEKWGFDRPEHEIIHLPAASILRNDPTLILAEQLAAQFYGSDQTLFLGNGSSQGIHAIIMAACKPGDRILVPRNAHRSLLAALVFSGANPVFTPVRMHPRLGLPLPPKPALVARLLAEDPCIRAVFAVHPTYEGITGDLAELIKVAHQANIPVLVDEAHGPHFGIHPHLPRSAIQLGADGVVQSTHKIVGALTQASMLHVQGDLLCSEKIKQAVGLLDADPMNMGLIASLDSARVQLEQQGYPLLDRTIYLAQQLREGINQIPGFVCFGSESIGEHGIHGFDPSKITVDTRASGIHGRDAERWLRQQYHIQAEFADPGHVLFILTIADTEGEIKVLLNGLWALSNQSAERHYTHQDMRPYPQLPIVSVPMMDAVYHNSRWVYAADAAGRVCASTISPYPPGIPLIYPGELFDDDTMDYILWGHEVSLNMMGIRLHDGHVQVRVMDDDGEAHS